MLSWLDSVDDSNHADPYYDDLDYSDELGQVLATIEQSATEVARLSRQVLTSTEWKP